MLDGDGAFLRAFLQKTNVDEGVVMARDPHPLERRRRSHGERGPQLSTPRSIVGESVEQPVDRAAKVRLLLASYRAINKAWRVWGDGMSPKVLWGVVRSAAARAGIDKLAPHDLRCTCLCHLAGGELDQIHFLLGHVSMQTTERYLGCKQKLRIAVNDRLGLEPTQAS